MSAFIFKVKSYMFGDGKSRGPGQEVYVGRLDKFGVNGSATVDGRNWTVTSDTWDPVRGSMGGNAGSLPVAEAESGRIGNG
jgi:hypothetical protein